MTRKGHETALSLLGYALLSLLARARLSGYDLAREMRKPHAFFFGQGHVSQIYPELARLEAAGLVTVKVVEQQNRPDKKLYALSAAGLAELQAWLVEPTPMTEPRSAFLIKAHSLWLADPTQALIQFRERERYHQGLLEAYEADLARVETRYGDAIATLQTSAFGDYLTLMRAVGYEREHLAWLRWVIALLERRSLDTPRGLQPDGCSENACGNPSC
jgi:DNA-binding PadR family transcriptional regulator